MRRPWEKPLDEDTSGVAIPEIRWCSGISRKSETVAFSKEYNDSLVHIASWSIKLSLTVHMSISMYALVVSKCGPRSCSIYITWEPDRQILDVMCIHLPIYIQAYKLTSPTSCPHVTFSTPNCTPNILNHNPPCRISSSDSNARSSLKGTAEYHSKVNTFSSVSPILLDSTTKST